MDAVPEEIAKARLEYVSNLATNGGLVRDRCNKCGRFYDGFHCVLDLTFKCIICAAEERYPIPEGDVPPEDQPSSGAIPLDLNDFATI